MNHNTLTLPNDFIGFERLFDRMMGFQKTVSYPPYNIRRDDREENTRYVIELAVAGFRKEDVEIKVTNNRLSISGDQRKDESDDNYLHRGIASRSFYREFTLNEYVVVEAADLRDGMLYVFLRKEIPETKKPKIIRIGE